MKLKLFIITLLLVIPSAIMAQTNSEIASVYVKRAEDSFFNLEYDKSLEIFNKALKYMDSVPNSRVAKLGAMLYYEHGEFFNARSYARSYFELETDKTTEAYQNMLDVFVNIQEEIDNYIEEQKALEIQRKKEEKEARRIDSLSNLWTDLSKAYAIKIDTVYTFNKYKLAIFSLNGKLGIINDVGLIIEQPSDYTHHLSYDGYILMLNKPNNPTKVYAFNSRTKSGFLLPSITAFNATSTSYGKVMLPRANGVVVTYPDNSGRAYVYNLNDKSFVDSDQSKELLKELKKNDIIEKYNKDGQIRIDKQWLSLGSHLGANIYELYNNTDLYGFLSTSDGKIWEVAYYNYLGGFCDDNFELLEGDKRFWIDAEGVRRESNKDENGTYSGTSRFSKNANGDYTITQNRGGKDYFILGDKALLNKTHFVAEAPR